MLVFVAVSIFLYVGGVCISMGAVLKCLLPTNMDATSINMDTTTTNMDTFSIDMESEFNLISAVWL